MSTSKSLSDFEKRCAQFLSEITGYGENYAVISGPPELRGKRLVDYSLGELCSRLAEPGQDSRLANKQEVMSVISDVLGSKFGVRGIPLTDSVTLRQLLQ